MTTECSNQFCNNPDLHVSIDHQCGYCSQLHFESQCGDRDKFWLIKCPICRVNSCIDYDSELIADDNATKCIICHDSDATIKMANCTHTVICRECAAEMDQHRDKNNMTAGVEFNPESHARQEATDQMGVRAGKIYCEVYAGMGCLFFCKRNGVGQPVELFFMHSDNWGQYGPLTDDTPKLKMFLNGYQNIDPDGIKLN